MDIDIKDMLARISQLPPAEQKEALELVELAAKKKRVENCRSDFMSFVKEMWPIFIPGAHHKRMADAFERIAEGSLKRVIICMPPRHPYSLQEEIPTPNGFKTIESIQVGDEVFGRDGKPVKVLGKSPIYHGRPCFRVTTDDGASVVCDENHLWTVHAISRRNGPLKEYTTRSLYERMQSRIGGEARNPRLPSYEAAAYPWRELLVDPYTLGLWIGDGHRNQAIITSSDEDSVVVRARVEAGGFTTTDQATRMTFGILKLKSKLRTLGVLGNKHIPQAYLESGYGQRLELLRGLMDSDGNVSKKGQCFFATKNPSLRDQVMELLASLGVKSSYSTSHVFLNGIDYGDHYRITFYMKDCARLPRKKDRTIEPLRSGRYIVSIEPVDSVPVQCVQVDAADELFLVGRRYVVGHNTKSELGSWLFPSWFIGKFPHKKVIQASNTAELAVGFGRKVRDLIDSANYKSIFPDVGLKADNTAAGRWSTTKDGTYFAIGVGGAVTGKGADVFIIDDAHSEQEARQAEYNPEVFDGVYHWYTSGPRQRLQPGGAIVIIMTRWSKRDLVGQILKRATETGEKWEVIEFPAILPSGNPLWPEFWPLDQLEALRRELPVPKWNAQYQQNPTSDAAAIVKREWWREWEQEKLPEFDAILQSWDTAFTKTERSNHSACTTWGIFDYPDSTGKTQANIMLIDAFKEKLEFPELKAAAKALYKEYNPDICIIENKAAGGPLIYELRSAGVPVSEFSPTRGNDKVARLNSVSDIFASGRVWYVPCPENEEVVEEVASFPNGESDDLSDTTSQALIRFRQGGWVSTNSDDEDELDNIYRKKRKAYY